MVVTDNLGCTDTSRTVNINLHPQPAAGFTINNTSQCISGNNFVFTNSSTISSGSLTFLWNFGDGNTANSTNPNHSYTAIGTYSVKLVATSINGCKDSVTQIVSVSNGPLASFTSNNSNQCLNGNNFVFTNTSSTFGTMSYSWSFGDGNSAITTNSTHTYLAAGNYNVKLVATSNNSCKDSSSQQITVFAQPLPAPVTANGPLSFCQGNSVILSTTGASLLQWFRDGSPISVATFNNLLVNQSGTYTVTSTNINGCNSVSTAVVVIINTVPNGILQNPSQNFICQGSTVTLTASGATSYQWYRNATPIAGAVNATYNAGLPGTYTVEFINAGCRRLSNNSIPLSLITSPQTDFSFNSSCENTPVIFNNLSNISGSGPVNYNWNFGDAGTSSLNNPVHTYLSAATYNAKLVVTSIQCPQLKDSIIKMVRVEKALQGIAYTPVNAFINSTVPLVARNIGINYLWVPGTYLNNPTIRTPDVTPVQNQTYLIVITSAAGCITVDTQLVRIFKEKEIYVPNGFSPNNDGSNDKLIPILVGISELKYFRVYDRWGQIVYETKQAGQGWDGYYKGAKQPMDTYNWIAEAIDIDGNVLKRSGATLLLR